MPRFDTLNSRLRLVLLAGRTREAGLKRAVLVGLALFIAGAAPAEEMKSPQISRARVDWDAAAASLPERLPADRRRLLPNSIWPPKSGFPGIANSAVPVLLPFDIDGFVKDMAANPGQPPEKIAESAARFMRSDFQPTKFFLTGPAGYDAAFSLTLASVPDLSDIRYGGASLRPVLGPRA